MAPNEQLHQQLWELIYELLPDDEAESLRARITSEPDVARAYVTAKLQSELVAQAAMWDEPPVPLARPDVVIAAEKPAPPLALGGARRPKRQLSPAARAANWLVGLAATALLCLAGYAHLKPDSAVNPLAVKSSTQAIARGHVRMVVTHPSRLQAEISNPVTIQTVALDGSPLATKVECRLVGADGKLRWKQAETTDREGSLRTGLPVVSPADDLRFEVETIGAVSPKFTAQLEVARSQHITYLSLDKFFYRPGETIFYRSVTLSRFDHRAEGEIPVQFEILDPTGAVISGSQHKGVTEHGVGNGSFTIPDESPGGRYTLLARSPDDEFPEQRREFFLAVAGEDRGAGETTAENMTIDVGRVEVEFYPEGGDLVGGLESRVYFHSHNPLGEPAHVEGRVVDTAGEEAAEIETRHEGRGVFQFTPQSGRRYRLVIDQPVGAASRPQLPRVAENRTVVISTGRGVFEPAAPVELTLRSTETPGRLVVAAYCRGAMVGLESVDGRDFQADASNRLQRRVSLPLAPEAQGVIRVTVYDFSEKPRRPIAERLVYRRPVRKLNVHFDGVAKTYAPRDEVRLSLVATDENASPLGAAFGVSAVDESLFDPAKDSFPAMPAYFHLATEIDNPQALEDANFYLSENEEAAEALDLLLGTQGRRRPAVVQFDQLAHRDLRGAALPGLGVALESADRMSAAPESPVNEKASIANRDSLARLAATDDRASPPVVYDNRREVERDLGQATALFHKAQEFELRRFGRILFFGGIGVLVAVAWMGAMRLTASVKVWLPALGAAAAVLILGVMWMGARVDPRGEVAFAFQGPWERTQRVARLDQAMVAAAPKSEVTGAAEVAEVELAGIEEPARRTDYAVPAPAAQAPAAALGEAAREGAGILPETPRPVERFSLADDDAESSEPGLPQTLPAPRMETAAPARRFRSELMPRKNLEQAEADAEAVRAGRYAGSAAASRELRETTAVDQKERLLLYSKVPEDLPGDYRFPVRQYGYQQGRKVGAAVQGDSSGTLFWHPLLITDGTGRAEIRFELPDRPATFRLRADGHAGGRLGSAEVRIISQSPSGVTPAASRP